MGDTWENAIEENRISRGFVRKKVPFTEGNLRMDILFGEL